jgi:hypothetical protein
MVHAPKCRAADDLLLAAENHPDLEDTRLEFAFRNTDDLIRIATGADPLPIRALSVWYAIGTDRRPSPNLSSRQGEPTVMFNALRGIIDPAVWLGTFLGLGGGTRLGRGLARGFCRLWGFYGRSILWASLRRHAALTI